MVAETFGNMGLFDRHFAFLESIETLEDEPYGEIILQLMESMKQMRRIYLDYASTTPVDPEVVLAMEPYWNKTFGNAGSIHACGQEGMKAVDDAREVLKNFLGASALREIIFTGSATEANNIALQGVIQRFAFRNGKKTHAITTVIEHPSVLEPLRKMEVKGLVDITYIRPSRDGIVDPEEIRKALRPETVLVSVGYANNEIGVIQPISEISKIIRDFSNGISKLPYFHTDSAQAAQYLDMNVENLGIDLMTISAHKIYGPKGIGGLFMRGGIELEPLLYGGGQEYGIRPSTQNVPLIVGFARAIEILTPKEGNAWNDMAKKLQAYALEKIQDIHPAVEVNGSLEHRLPHNLNICFPGKEAELLLIGLSEKGICVSSGAACSSRSQKPSHVIQGIGKTERDARSSLRITLGRTTTKNDIDRFIDSLQELLL
ncbi:MAG: cysteine desulfurase [Candidatus Niyogibacteria bacterium]|nr:cysteine desulfurase [Candidatus Niyogibacteria bacterium]